MRPTDERVFLYRTAVDSVAVPWEHYERLAYEALSRLELPLPATGTVLLKPNITIPADPDSRIITHPAFIVGLLRALLEQGVPRERLVVAEAANDRGDGEWARASRYQDALAGLGLELTGMTGGEGRRVPIPDAHVFRDGLVLFPQVGDCSMFLNVPVAKCHNLSCTTLSTKNLQGAVTSPQRHMCSVQAEDQHLPAADLSRLTEAGLSLHEERFCHKHADLVSALRQLQVPRLNIIDGMVGRDGTAFREGRNHPLGWTVIGTNETHVDTVGTYLFGLDPTATPYLRVAAARGLGTHRIAEIEVVDLATGRALSPTALAGLRAQPPLLPLSRFSGGHYARFRTDGTVVPWWLDRVNEQRVLDGLDQIAAA